MSETAINQTPSLDTIPKLLHWHAQQQSERAAIREKKLGIWRELCWRDLYDLVACLSGSLLANGIVRGDHIALIADNRPRFYAAMFAAQSIGAIPVALYQEAVASEYITPLNDGEVKLVFAENQEQVDKISDIREQIHSVRTVVVDDAQGMRHYDHDGLIEFDAFEKQGQDHAESNPGFFEALIDRGQTGDVAALFFTSGTTGVAKGVVHTHSTLLTAAKFGVDFDRLSADEEVLAYLPVAWIGQNIFSVAQFMICGYTVNCPESANTTAIDLREIGPTYYFAPPRVFEGLLTQVLIRMEDASWLKRKIFNWAMKVANRYGPTLTSGHSVTVAGKLLYWLGNFLIYGPLRNTLGLSRVRVAYTAGEAIGPDLFKFYRAIGVNLKQLYGSTETAVFVCLQPDDQVRADTVGRPVGSVELKVTDSGEILVRSPGMFIEYFNAPEATAEVKDEDGWFRTGDAGYLDQEGHLRIIDRAKDVGKMADGTLFAPKFIENKLKFFPYIQEAVAFGANREQVCCFINIDFEAVGNWAERRNIAYAGYTDLAGKLQVGELIDSCVDKVNADLAQDEKLSGAQISRFLVLHKELDPDDEELTRTRKVRRSFVGRKYEVLVDALFSGATSQFISTQVKFEDGRTGAISANLKIYDCKRLPVAA